MKSERETSRRPSVRWAWRATSPRRVELLLGQVGAVEGDELGGVAGGEVELVALLVLDGDRLEGPEPLVGLEDDDRHVDAVVEPLDQRVLAVGVGADQRRGERGEPVDAGDTEGRSAAGRLHDDAGAEPVHDVLHQRGGADVAEGLGGEPDRVGDGDAVAAQQLAGGGLVVGEPAGVAAGADVRHPDQLEQGLDLAVLAELAVQRRQHRDHLVALEGVQQVAVEVVGVRLDAQRAQLADQVATAGQRDVALVAQPAGDHGDRAGELLHGHGRSLSHSGAPHRSGAGRQQRRQAVRCGPPGR